MALRTNRAGPRWLPGETVNQHGQAWRHRVYGPAGNGPKWDRLSRSRGSRRDFRPQQEPLWGWMLQSLLCPPLARGPPPQCNQQGAERGRTGRVTEPSSLENSHRQAAPPRLHGSKGHCPEALEEHAVQRWAGPPSRRTLGAGAFGLSPSTPAAGEWAQGSRALCPGPHKAR